MPNESSAPLPRPLRAAVVLLYVYAAYVLVAAIVFQSLSGWENWIDFPRGLIRSAGVGLLASQLAKRVRWVWMLTVGFGAFAIVLGVVGVGFALYFDSNVIASVPIEALVSVGVAFALLAAAIVLLLHPASRTAFRARAG